MKKIIALIGILVLIVPSALSFYFYQRAVAEENAREKLVSVLVVSPDKKEYTYSVGSENKKDAEAIALFRSFLGLSEKSEKTHEEFSFTGSVFTVKYITTHGERSVTVYVVKKDTSFLAYFDGGNGMYCLDEDVRTAFLSSEFSLCVYDASEIPRITGSGTIVEPSSAEWKIKKFCCG